MALLRLAGIPAGFCYQRLTVESTSESGYCLHEMAAVRFSGSKRWLRIDVRGNKAGVDAQFYPDREQLAFPARRELDEREYPFVYAQPLPSAMRVMESLEDLEELIYRGLPPGIPAEELPKLI